MISYLKSARLVILLTSIFVGAPAGALACSTDGWLGGVSGGTADSPPAVARYSEFCAYALTDEGYVQSNLANDAKYRARFYVLDGLTGGDAIDIFEAYASDAATGPLFKVAFDGSQFTFDATAAGGGAASVAASSGWNVVEFDWDSGTNTFSYWVNTDASVDPTSGSVAAGTGTVQAVRLGAPNGFLPQTGKLTFDAFESHRANPVGTLLAGDSNGNGSINVFDMISIQNEILDPLNKLALGQPDCNGNGSVNVFDMICVQNIILGN
jgi:hypothetical protein